MGSKTSKVIKHPASVETNVVAALRIPQEIVDEILDHLTTDSVSDPSGPIVVAMLSLSVDGIIFFYLFSKQGSRQAGIDTESGEFRLRGRNSDYGRFSSSTILGTRIGFEHRVSESGRFPNFDLPYYVLSCPNHGFRRAGDTSSTPSSLFRRIRSSGSRRSPCRKTPQPPMSRICASRSK